MKAVDINPPEKACAYYWTFPWVFIKSGFYGILLLILVLIGAVGLFIGFRPDFESELPNNKMFYPYKSGKKGKWKIPIAPWEATLAIGALYGLYQLIFWIPDNVDTVVSGILVGLKFLIIGLAALCAILTFGYVIRYSVAPSIKNGAINFYNEHCPKLVVVGEEIPAEESIVIDEENFDVED
ncbi:MAG TPA: hypothetical protein VGO63_00780 [Candidatus Paceibacterota bacterium]|jgi:hypothetical protein|nr:hypothetical protein [Candidatus Paceibacterota bacterium]